jgi:hypothetical protein
MKKSTIALNVFFAIVLAYVAVDFIAYAARHTDGGPLSLLWWMFTGR